MTVAVEGNKAKTARRVIEVLEFFDEQNRHATVMDIARRYKRPQSSTSELLASLVELGLLYKDPASRSYTPTPRAAILGSLSQPSLVRDGSLSLLIDRLVAQTGLGVVLLGMVGLNSQVFRWSVGSRRAPRRLGDLCGGAQERLCDSAAGQLLLSTVKADRRGGMLRRLNAEAPAEGRFNGAEMGERVAEAGACGAAVGPIGYGAAGEMAAVLLPVEPGDSPMALALVYEPGDGLDPATLVELLRTSVQRCLFAPPAEVQSAA